MQTKQNDMKTLNEAIETISKKATLIIKAKKMNLSKRQYVILNEIKNGTFEGAVKDWNTLKVLTSKDLVKTDFAKKGSSRLAYFLNI